MIDAEDRIALALSEGEPPAALRRAGPSDRADLLAMIAAYHAEDDLPTSATDRAAALDALLASADVGIVWRLERAGEPAEARLGYAAICFGWSLEFGGRDAFIDEIWIAPRLRRRGLGRAMLGAAIGEAERLGVRALHLEVDHGNSAALALYRAHGFALRERYALMTRHSGATAEPIARF